MTVHRVWPVVAAGLLACSGKTIDVGDSGGKKPDHLNFDGSDAAPPTPTATAALDGTWDIVTAGSDAASGSSFVVDGDSLAGVLVKASEGREISPGCVLEQDRVEFEFKASGNALKGSVTEVRHVTDAAGCPLLHNEVRTFSGVRDFVEPTTATDLNGNWTISSGDSTWHGSVDGLAGSGDTLHSAFKDPRFGSRDTLTMSVRGGIFTVSGNYPRLSFAARKR